MWRSHRFSQRILPLVFAAMIGSGCSSWRTVQVPPGADLDRESRSTNFVSVTLRDGRKFEVYRAKIIGDSLIGEIQDQQIPTRFGVPTSEVKLIQARRPDEARTVASTMVVMGLLIGIVLIVAFGASIGG